MIRQLHQKYQDLFNSSMPHTSEQNMYGEILDELDQIVDEDNINNLSDTITEQIMNIEGGPDEEVIRKIVRDNIETFLSNDE